MNLELAGVPGFEPGIMGSKPSALPLGYTPIIEKIGNYKVVFTFCKVAGEIFFPWAIKPCHFFGNCLNIKLA